MLRQLRPQYRTCGRTVVRGRCYHGPSGPPSDNIASAIIQTRAILVTFPTTPSAPYVHEDMPGCSRCWHRRCPSDQRRGLRAHVFDGQRIRSQPLSPAWRARFIVFELRKTCPHRLTVGYVADRVADANSAGAPSRLSRDPPVQHPWAPTAIRPPLAIARFLPASATVPRRPRSTKFNCCPVGHSLQCVTLGRSDRAKRNLQMADHRIGVAQFRCRGV